MSNIEKKNAAGKGLPATLGRWLKRAFFGGILRMVGRRFQMLWWTGTALKSLHIITLRVRKSLFV